ncbi:MAG: hypothetical protein CME71_11695 [Halobacteriovorax sp.]|nr:hypothetical protein [Halobacteriovorax sp.]|tara:strand:+ start:4671 stop:5588 length:918 start_codon:yes stop_codon:yes gene_type:complete
MNEIMLGGSDANRIMNNDAMTVFEEKIGHAEREDLSRVLPVQIGIVTEELNCRWYKENANLAAGVKLVRNINDYEGAVRHLPMYEDTEIFPQDRLVDIRQGQVGVRHPEYPWIVGHFDGVILHDNKPVSIFEAKHTGALSKWNPPEAVVKRNLWQCLLYMMIAEVRTCEVSVFYGNREWQIHNIALDHHIEDAAVMLNRLQQMYDAIQNKEPLADWDTDPKVVPVLHAEKRTYNVQEMKDTNWYPEFAELEREYVDTYNSAASHWAAEKKLKGLVPGDAKLIDGKLITISINRANRKSIEVKDGN